MKITIDIRHVHSAVGKELLNHDGKQDYDSFLDHLFKKFSVEDIEREIIELPKDIYEKAVQLTSDLIKMFLSNNP